MATAYAFRATADDYTPIMRTPLKDGAKYDATPGLVTSPGTSLSEPAGFFASPNWCDLAFVCVFGAKRLVIIQYDDPADVLDTVDHGLSGTFYDRDLGANRTDRLIRLSLSAGDVIDEFTASEIASLASRADHLEWVSQGTPHTRLSVSEVFDAHGLTRFDPPAP
jgi:hypothetical protein